MIDYNIKKVFEDMELELILSMKRNLSRHLKEEEKVGFNYSQWQAEKLKELKRYQRENKDIISSSVKGLNKKISQHLKEELNQGSINAIKQYNEIYGTKKSAKKIMNKSFFKTNDRKINSLIKVINDDLNRANTGALRMINDEYRQVIHKSAFYVANGVYTGKQAIDMATKEFLSRGINCIEYKNGRRVNIASYSEMAVRTASIRAQLMGEGDFRKSIGRTLVQVISHNGSCPLCEKWENQILIDDVYSGGKKEDGKFILLSEAMKQGLLHPNCKCGLATYYPELTEINESYEDGKTGSESDSKYQEDLNYINQKIKQFKRLSLGSLDKDNIEGYEQKKLYYESKKSEILQNSLETKYIDITEEWINNANSNSHEVKDINYYIHNNITYKVDGKNVVLDYSKNEKDIAEWIEKTFGGEIYMVPRINKPDNISTPDYIWNQEKWDLKGINGSGKRVIEDAIKRKKQQSNNFIFDVTNSDIDEKDLIRQIKKIYISKSTEFVDKIIVKKGNTIICIYKRK